MKELFLTAKNTAQERIKAYLEQNASDELAYKINVGAPIEKDGKQLFNRKTLDGFMKYATEEARKTAEKGARFACIDDATVFGWAIHYFEEDSITELLYNADGTEYKTAPKQNTAPKNNTTPKNPTKTAKTPPTPPKAEPPKQEPTPTPKTPQKQSKPTDTDQVSIFDLF